MAFPRTPLPVGVHIAPGANPAGDPGTWTWRNITPDVRVSDGISIEAGRDDEAARVDAGKCTLTIDNRDGDYSPRNPAGQWYGTLSKNTPLQVRLDRGRDDFDRVSSPGWGVADSGQTWTHSSPSTWTATGTVGRKTIAVANTADYAFLPGANAHDVDLLYAVAAPVVTSGAGWVSAAVVRYRDLSNQYRVFTELKPGGVITVKIFETIDGDSNDMVESLTPGVTYAANDVIWTRVQADGPTIRARIWKNASPEPTTWTVSTDLATASSGTTVGLYQWRVAGNTNMTYIDVGRFQTTAILFTGTVAEWPVRWDQSGNDCTTQIEAAGILRRLNQGKSAIRSPLYRQLSGYNPAGYWPLEDGSDATSAGSAAINGRAATIVDVEFGVEDCPPGASSAAKLTSPDARIYQRVLRSTGTGFACMFLTKFSALPGVKQVLCDFVGSGTVRSWRMSYDTTGIWMEGRDPDGNTITGGVGGLYAVDPTQWVAWQLEGVQVGGNVNWSYLWHQVGTQTFYAYTGSIPGTVGKITNYAFYGSTALLNTSVSHIWIGADTLPFVDSRFSLVSNGYAGETAAERVERLCAQQGIRSYVEAGDSQPMGRQKIATFLDSLRDCENADLGILYESGAALAYKPYGARLNIATEADLDFAAGEIAAPPEPTDDDQRVRNDITVQRTTGGEVRVSDEAHAALNGRYDEALEVNVRYDDQLDDIAGWTLHLGTWDEMRWPSITLDLAHNPERIPYWFTMQRPGARFSVSNPPDQVAGDELDLIVEGYKQVLSVYSWDVELSCSPARPWDVAVTDNVDWRVDTDGSRLAASCTSTATSLSVNSDDNYHWTTSGAEYPFDINLAGELCTVTNVTGAGATQTFTVTRSVNGIVMSHPTGADVRLWTSAYVSL